MMAVNVAIWRIWNRVELQFTVVAKNINTSPHRCVFALCYDLDELALTSRHVLIVYHSEANCLPFLMRLKYTL